MRKCSGYQPFAISLSLGLAVAMGLCCISADAQQKAAAPAPKATTPKATPAPKPAPVDLPKITGPITAPSIGFTPAAALTPEKLDKAYDMEAQTVARQLKLDTEKSAKLVEAYKAARQNHRKAAEEKMGTGQMTRENYEAIQALAGTERTKLETTLKGFLSDDQVAQATATLGTFSRRWDQMVSTLDTMDLKADAKDQAMDLVAAFIKDTGEASRAATTDADRQALREKNRQRREQLDADLAKVLTPDQLAKWKEATSMRRGRR